MDLEPWRLDYKIVTWKLEIFKSPELIDAPRTERGFDEFFPVHTFRRARTVDVPANAIPPFTEELNAAAKCLKKEWTLGPNGIPSEVLQTVGNCPTVPGRAATNL